MHNNVWHGGSFGDQYCIITSNSLHSYRSRSNNIVWKQMCNFDAQGVHTFGAILCVEMSNGAWLSHSQLNLGFHYKQIACILTPVHFTNHTPISVGLFNETLRLDDAHPSEPGVEWVPRRPADSVMRQRAQLTACGAQNSLSPISKLHTLVG